MLNFSSRMLARSSIGVTLFFDTVFLGWDFKVLSISYHGHENICAKKLIESNIPEAGERSSQSSSFSAVNV